MNLAELKAENAAEEKKTPTTEEPKEEAQPADPDPAVDDQTASEEGEEAPEEEGSEEQDGEQSDEDGEQTEPWMQSEEEEGKEEAKFTDSDAAHIRRKFKAKLDAAKEEKNAEIEELRKEIEALKKNKSQVTHPQAQEKPKRDDFDDDDQFFEALTDYKISLLQDQGKSEQAAAEKKRQAAREREEVDKAVDGHYERAAKLAEKSGIKAEAYQSADRKVREAVDSIFPQGGDAITDKLISLVGEGSEKVFYHLGVNPSKMQKFKESFARDNTGLAAAAYLGRLNAELTMPEKRKTRAPEPGAEVHGDNANSSSLKALAEKYKQARKSGNAQKAYDIKKEAKKAGHDTKSW